MMKWMSEIPPVNASPILPVSLFCHPGMRLVLDSSVKSRKIAVSFTYGPLITCHRLACYTTFNNDKSYFTIPQQLIKVNQY